MQNLNLSNHRSKECATKRLWYILPVFFCALLDNVHYFLTNGKGAKNTCKLDATVNFFSADAGNITVKEKRKSNLENYNQILCFATRVFY